MNRIITLLTLFFIVAIGYAQCPDPIADAVQYVCPSSNSELDDLSVTVSGTAVWYDDDGKSNALPATTPIIDGKTYYVANNDGTCESNVIPIRVYIQSVEFVVSPNSCLNLGKNIFFVEQGELNNPVEIEVLNHDGNPHTNKIVWSPMFTNEFEYYLPGFGWNGLIQTSQQGVFQYPPGLIFNHISKTLDPFELLELDVNISGDSCSDSQESITIIAGGIEFKELCYGVETTLENIKNYYATLLGNNLQFYDVESEGASLPLSTIIEGGDIFYIELDQLNCQTRIPVIVKYKTEQPYANTKYYACTQAAWSLIGIGDKETLHDINVSGTQLKWYDSSMNEITANPKNITLEHGDIFYVSNIVAGCESEPLKIEVFETDCGCLLNGNFEDQSGTVDFRDIKIFQNPISSYSINWNVCATDLLRTNQIVLGPPESPSVGSDTYTTFASIVSKGSDPTLEEVGVIGHPRTSPLRGESNFSLRLNRNIRNKSQSSGVVYLEKEFVAGEVFSFDFSMVMENPTHHIGVNSEPYFQVQILDQSNRVIESRCVTASLNDCILHDAGPFPGHTYSTLYTDWSCLKVNTREVQGQKVIARVIASTCHPDFHFSYVYVDNFYAGEDYKGVCDESAYGYIGLLPVEENNNSLNPYSECSIIGRSVPMACEASEPLVYPDFPINVFGEYSNPYGRESKGEPKSLTLEIYRDGVSVLAPGVNLPLNVNTTAETFVFSGIDPSIHFDPSIPLYGHFALEANIEWETECQGVSGRVEHNIHAQALSQGFKFCPVIYECLEDLKFCVSPTDTSFEVDLTVNEHIAKENYTDKNEVVVTYYRNLNAAHAGMNPIPQPDSEIFAIGTHTVYVRLDFDWNYINVQKVDNCYDIVPFEVIVSRDPELPADPVELETCEVDGVNGGYFELDDADLIDNILENVTVDKADHTLYFYKTQNGAENGDASDEIDTSSPYFITVGTETVWVRIMSPGDCHAVLEIELTVYPLPVLSDSHITIFACEDGSGSNQGEFNLPLQIDSEIVNPSHGYLISYFNDLLEAEAGDQQDAITTPGNYIGEDAEVIYVRIEDPLTDCSITTTVTLEVVESPVVPPLAELEVCDEGNGEATFNLGALISYIQDGNTTLTVDFYASAQDAEDEIAALPSSYTTSSTTIYIRVGAPGLDCAAIVSMDLVVKPTPVLPTSSIELESCANADGSDVTFELSNPVLAAQILADVSGDKTGYEIEFYLTQSAAENASLSDLIDSSVGYPVSGTTQIWVRVIDDSIGCFSIMPIDLIVYPLPELLSTHPTITVCGDGSGSNQGEFNLPGQINHVIVNPSDGYLISYFNDLLEAEVGDQQDAITTPGNYIGEDAEVIYVRIEDPLTDCSITTTVTLEVVESPVVPPLAELEACDEGNGEATFNLGALISYIQDGNTTLTVDFYASAQDAEDEIAALPSSYTTGSTTIYIRVGAPGSDCAAIVSMDLVVKPTPVLPTSSIELESCANADGSDVTFELSNPVLAAQILADVSGDKTGYEIEFYLTQSAAENASLSDLIDSSVGYPVSGTTQIWVRVIDDSIGCFSIMPIDLIVYPLPELLSTHPTITVCGDGSGSNQGEFNLPGQINHVIVNPSDGYLISYFNDLLEAEVGDQQDAITTPGNYIGEDAEVIYVRIEDPLTDCSITTTVTLEVVESPVVPPLAELEACDEGNGEATFNLGALISYIQDGNTTLTVDFYASAQDAEDEIAALPSSYTTSSTTIYIRVGTIGVDCFTIVSQGLIVIPNPKTPVIPAKVSVCELEDGSVLEFDLSSSVLTAQVLADVSGDKTGYEIEFYSSQSDAESGIGSIDSSVFYPVSGTPGSTIIWVRITNTSTECYSVAPVTLTVNPLPTVNSPVVLRECDLGSGNGISEFDLNEATILMVGLGSNYTVTYYTSFSNAEQATGAVGINYTNTVGYNDIIYARIEDNATECYIIEPIELEVLNAPVAQDWELIYCDPNNDGEGSFYLPDANAHITSDPNAVISYHRTPADADNDANPLPDTITNNMIDNQQYVYVRVEVDGVGCHTVVRIKLSIEATPELVSPSDIFIGCDEHGTGIHTFDLEEIVAEEVTILLNNPMDYVITYFETDANGDKSAQITTPSAYPSSGGTVIVVVTSPLTECFTEVELELFVAPLPEVFHPVPLELCDDNNPGDEKEEFYLDLATDEITGGNQSLTVTYHYSQADADNNENPLAIPYENEINNQTVYIRVENEWGCTVTTGITLTLVVNPLPAPVTPAPYEVCDIDNEGFAYFDLASLEADIINNEPDVSVSFHETYTDAMVSMNPLVSPYQNIVATEQVIFVRVENDNTQCFTIIEVIIRAVSSPRVPVELDDLFFCTPDMGEGVRVNLTVYETIIYGLQNRDELDLTYHLTEEAAHEGTGAIANPTDFLLNPPTPRTIWVRLGYKDDGCYNIVSFTLHLVEGPQINNPTALSMCTPLGEPNTETAVFDLLDKRQEIIGAQTGLGLRFYEDEADALLGNNNHISNPSAYTNIENPQVIYIRVVDSQENEDGEGCVSFTSLTLRVEPTPEAVTPEPIEVCHFTDSEEATIVDLTQRELQILNHEDWELEYYEKYRDAVVGDPFSPFRIHAPEAYEVLAEESPKTIYVRVLNPESGCFSVVELELILRGLPNMVLPEDIAPLVVCTTQGKDWAEFDLTLKIPDVFGNQNIDGLNVFFYETEEDAIAGENPIIDPDSYYNSSNPQIIYIGVANPDIEGCYYGGITWFEIEVREGAVAHSPATSYKVCGINDGSDGVAEFYLSNPALIDEILGLQDPSDFYIDFYEMEAAAEEGDVSFALGDYYTNSRNPQVIYARVTNKATGCYAIAEVSLEVVVLEDLILQDIYSLCTDSFGNIIEDDNGDIIYPIIDTGLDTDGFEFTWYFEGEVILTQVGSSLEVYEVGTYRVEIVSLSQGCVLIKDIEVVESSMPFSAGAQIVSPAFSGTYDLQAWAEGFGDYWFSLNGGIPQQEGLFTNVGAGTHVITIEDLNGCGSLNLVVNVVDYPKFFTPNDDGYNDTWNIPGMADLDPSAEIFIFDRHGKLLKQLNPLSEGWNGTYNGKPLPSTDYWFVVKYTEEGVLKEFKGHFSLKR